MTSLSEVNTTMTSPSRVSATMLMLMLIAALMVGAVWQKVQVGTLNSNIYVLKRELEDLKDVNEKATAEKLNLMSDYKLLHRATTELGMIRAPYEFVNLNIAQQRKMKKLESLLTKN